MARVTHYTPPPPPPDPEPSEPETIYLITEDDGSIWTTRKSALQRKRGSHHRKAQNLSAPEPVRILHPKAWKEWKKNDRKKANYEEKRRKVDNLLGLIRKLEKDK